MAYKCRYMQVALHVRLSVCPSVCLQVARERLNVLGRSVDCDAFVDVGGGIACTVEQLSAIVSKWQEGDRWGRHKETGWGSKGNQRFTCSSSPLSSSVELFSFDHHYPSATPTSSKATPTAVLYGQLGTPSLSSLHSALVVMAGEGKVQYVLRHYVRVRCCLHSADQLGVPTQL